MQRITAGGLVMAAGVGVCLAVMGPVLHTPGSDVLTNDKTSLTFGGAILPVSEPLVNAKPQSSVKNDNQVVKGDDETLTEDEPGMITRVVSLEGLVNLEAGPENQESAQALAGAALSAMMIADEDIKPEVRLMDDQALLVLRGTKVQTDAGLEVIAQKRLQVVSRDERVAQDAIAAAQQRAQTAEESALMLEQHAKTLEAELAQVYATVDQAQALLEGERNRALQLEQQLWSLQQQVTSITDEAQRAVNLANERAAYAEARLHDIAHQPPVVVVPSHDDESLRRRNWYLESQVRDLDQEVGILRGRLRDVRPLNSFAGNTPPVGPQPRGNSGRDGHDGHNGRGGHDRPDDRDGGGGGGGGGGGRGTGQQAPRDVSGIPGGPLPLPAPPRLEGPGLAFTGSGYQRKENVVSPAERAKQAAERENREREERAAREAREQQQKAQRAQADAAKRDQEARERAQREQESRDRAQREQAERERRDREKQERDRLAKEKQERERQERAQAEAQKRQQAEEKRKADEQRREEERRKEAERKNSGDPQPAKPRNDNKPKNSFGGNPPK